MTACYLRPGRRTAHIRRWRRVGSDRATCRTRPSGRGRRPARSRDSAARTAVSQRGCFGTPPASPPTTGGFAAYRRHEGRTAVCLRPASFRPPSRGPVRGGQRTDRCPALVAQAAPDAGGPPLGPASDRRHSLLVEPVGNRLQGHALSAHLDDPLHQLGVVGQRRAPAGTPVSGRMEPIAGLLRRASRRCRCRRGAPRRSPGRAPRRRWKRSARSPSAVLRQRDRRSGCPGLLGAASAAALRPRRRAPMTGTQRRGEQRLSVCTPAWRRLAGRPRASARAPSLLLACARASVPFRLASARRPCPSLGVRQGAPRLLACAGRPCPSSGRKAPPRLLASAKAPAKSSARSAPPASPASPAWELGSGVIWTRARRCPLERRGSRSLFGVGFVLAGSGLAVGPSGRGFGLCWCGGDEPPRQNGAGRRADDPVDGQALAGLKALNGGLGQGSKAPVEWPRALARPNQLLLQCPNLFGAVWLAVAGAG